jgi:hypothetical protein
MCENWTETAHLLGLPDPQTLHLWASFYEVMTVHARKGPNSAAVLRVDQYSRNNFRVVVSPQTVQWEFGLFSEKQCT